VALRLIGALQRSDQNDEADEVLSLFIQQNPSSVPGLILVASSAMQDEAWPEAIRVYENLRTRLGDNDATLLNNLAWARYRTGDTAEALTLAAKAHAMTPQSGAAADTYGWILFKTGRDRNQGLALLRRAVAASPTNPGVRWHLAQGMTSLRAFLDQGD